MRRLTEAAGEAFSLEQDRFFLWVPVLFGAGIALYFALPVEPPLALVLVAAGAAVAGALAWRRGLAGLVIGGGLAWLAAGLASARLASELAAAPVLGEEVRAGRVTGWVELVEPRPGGDERITLRVASLEGGVDGAPVPLRVRVRVPAGPAELAPGQAVGVRANLLAPAGPVLPGAYDFARTAWFRGIGAVGFARERPEAVAITQPMPWMLRLWVPIERLRQVIGRRIQAALPGETGAIAAALVTGERGGITEATNTAYRDSGIFHILSISGLHMTVFAGALYVAVRALLSLIPVLALDYQIKKWAAVAGMLGTLAYLLISGGSPPAVRSAIMIAIMFLAVLLDRPALALRNVALAAIVLLVVAPQSLIDVGFQMSFAAVVALIAGVEAWRDWQHQRGTGAEPPRRGVLGAGAAFLAGIVATTLIATLSVAPFAAYYFHKSAQYGVLANLVAIPVCNLVVMPAALATLIAMPMGLEWAPLAVMGSGIEAMTWIAYRVAGLPGAVIALPEISGTAFGLMVGGGIWLALWAQPWRLAGIAAMLAGLLVAPLRAPPDVLVGGGGQLVAVRGPDKRLAALDLGRSRFELGRWLEQDGDMRRPEEVGPGRVFRCDPAGCMAEVRGHRIAVVRHASALRDDCRLADLVVWMGQGRTAACPAAARAQVIDRAALEREGAHAISFGGGAAAGMAIATVAGARGARPWSKPRPAGGRGQADRLRREAPD